MTQVTKALAVAIAVVALLALAIIAGFVSSSGGSNGRAAILAAAAAQQGQSTPSQTGECTVDMAGAPLSLAPDQVKNAATIMSVGRNHGFSDYGLVIALATAMQESTLYNINYGDRDSVGLFQQRTSQGWGTIAEIMDPVKSSEAFYGVATHTRNTGLNDIAGWESMPVTVAAQRVQRSGFPGAYAKWETLARSIVSGAGFTCTEAPAPTGSGEWGSPLARGTYVLTSPFGYRIHPILGYSKLHTGMDFGAASGTPLYAACNGNVVYAGAYGTAGNMTSVDCGGGVVAVYMHQSRIDTSVGAQVTVGKPIGAVGSTGLSTGPHLHFEIRLNGTYLDPKSFMADRGVIL